MIGVEEIGMSANIWGESTSFMWALYSSMDANHWTVTPSYPERSSSPR